MQKLRLRPEVMTVSAKNGRNVKRLFHRAVALADRGGAPAHRGSEPLPVGSAVDPAAAGGADGA